MEAQHQPGEEQKKSIMGNLVKTVNQKLVPVFLLISVVVSFCMLVIGSLNVHRCPVNRYIPVFLIATGTMGMVSKILSFVRRKYVHLSDLIYVRCAETMLYFAEVVFLLLGTYWVFKEFQPSFEPGNKLYCNKTAYMFAFLYLTVHYTLLMIAIFGLLGLMCCMAASGSRSSYTVEAPPEAGPEPVERVTLTSDVEGTS